MITYREIKEFTKSFNMFESCIGFEFMLKFHENLEIAEKLLQRVEKLKTESPGIKEYRKKGQSLYFEAAKKTPDGKPILEPVVDGDTVYQKYVIDPEKQTELDKNLADLRDANKDILAEHAEKLQEYYKALASEVKVKWVMIPKDEIPDNISNKALNLLYRLKMINFKTQ